jgi:hypothetical protein
VKQLLTLCLNISAKPAAYMCPMRVTPDAQFFTSLSRDMATRRDTNSGGAFARQSAISDAYARRAEPVRTAAPAAKHSQRQPEEERSGSGSTNDAASHRREAPLGQRPKYVPKGQTINLLI